MPHRIHRVRASPQFPVFDLANRKPNCLSVFSGPSDDLRRDVMQWPMLKAKSRVVLATDRRVR